MAVVLDLKLLGPFNLTGPSGRIALSSAKLTALVAYLAVMAKPVPRDELTFRSGVATPKSRLGRISVRH
jgi:hypothetical protein